MRIINAVLHVGKRHLVAVVESGGKRRKIDYKWHTKGAPDILPDSWVSALEGETAHQESVEKLKAQGRFIPL